LQINTGKGCHLDARMIGQALHQLSPADDSLLLIENVGNLVCPAAFDLGEAHKVIPSARVALLRQGIVELQARLAVAAGG
jgi:Ni2+-binding GTPase involved in maturation of urease and hydrogenase